jgi:hypothetical protein
VLFAAFALVSYIAASLIGRAQAAENAGIIGRVRQASSVVAKHGAATDVPVSGNTWTQGADELELVSGTVLIHMPVGCTGAFVNALTLSVDGKPVTFASVPVVAAPGGASDQTIQFLVGTVSEPGHDTDHTLTAKFGNGCTRDGEDYGVKDLNVDVLGFH